MKGGMEEPASVTVFAEMLDMKRISEKVAVLKSFSG
jgi:hypothetical protein